MHVVERAYVLARSGRFRIRSEIGKTLHKEGYSHVDLRALEGRAITDDLNRLCKVARG